MKVTVTCTDSDNILSLDVPPDIELENFKVMVQVEAGIDDLSNMVFLHNGRVLMDDKKALNTLGVNDGDMLLFGRLPQGGQPAQNTQRMRQPAAPARPRTGGGSGKICQHFSFLNNETVFLLNLILLTW